MIDSVSSIYFVMRFIDYIDKDIQTWTNSSSLTFPSSKRDKKKPALQPSIGERETMTFAWVLSVAADSSSKLLSMPTQRVDMHPIRRYFNSLGYS